MNILWIDQLKVVYKNIIFVFFRFLNPTNVRLSIEILKLVCFLAIQVIDEDKRKKTQTKEQENVESVSVHDIIDNFSRWFITCW